MLHVESFLAQTSLMCLNQLLTLLRVWAIHNNTFISLGLCFRACTAYLQLRLLLLRFRAAHRLVHETSSISAKVVISGPRQSNLGLRVHGDHCVYILASVILAHSADVNA